MLGAAVMKPFGGTSLPNGKTKVPISKKTRDFVEDRRAFSELAWAPHSGAGFTFTTR